MLLLTVFMCAELTPGETSIFSIAEWLGAARHASGGRSGRDCLAGCRRADPSPRCRRCRYSQRITLRSPGAVARVPMAKNSATLTGPAARRIGRAFTSPSMNGACGIGEQRHARAQRRFFAGRARCESARTRFLTATGALASARDLPTVSPFGP